MRFFSRFKRKNASSILTSKQEIFAPMKGTIRSEPSSPIDHRDNFQNGHRHPEIPPAPVSTSQSNNQISRNASTLAILEGHTSYPLSASTSTISLLEPPSSPDTVPTATQPPFPFLSLPTELRLSIYDHLLEGRDHSAATETFIRLVAAGHCIGMHQPAFTRVCRTMRTESLPLFYRHNAFHVNFADDSVRYTHPHDLLAHWLTIIGAVNASHLRKIVIQSRILHIRALTLECEPGRWPEGRASLEMEPWAFVELWQERSRWLLETFLLNGFESGAGELGLATDDVREVADLVWQLQRRVQACKHRLRRMSVNSDWCEECQLYRYRRPDEMRL